MKVFVLQYPAKAPGKCALCGANHKRDGRQYIDFGLTIPRYGVVYLCTLCMTETAGILGWINPAQAEELKTAYQETIQLLANLREENGRLRRALSELDFLDSRNDGDSFPVEAFSGDTKIEESGNNESDESIGESEGDQSGSPEPDNESGSSGVFSVDLANSV